MYTTRWGIVTKIKKQLPDYGIAEVRIEDEIYSAVFYPAFTGFPQVGDKVLLNTTAVELKLGTGGHHFIQGCGEKPPVAASGPGGHIMKLRYTPWQFPVLSVEEENSPWHEIMAKEQSIAGTPVVVATLHSMLIPAILGWRLLNPSGTRVVLCMTDGAALPAAISDTLRALREENMLDAVITTGHSFGGDYEAVNIYSGLIAAKHVAKADLIIVAMGPGIVGTGTPFGYTGLEQGINIDAAANLGGLPVAAVRLSFADRRPRHYGISEHNLVALSRACSHCALIPLPVLEEENSRLVEEKLSRYQIQCKHKVISLPFEKEFEVLQSSCLPMMKSMGRSFNEDPYFFITACLAGRVAAELWKGLRSW